MWRKRQLDQIEISEDHVTITDELLGKGGFGSVYIADYNGWNAAAKARQRAMAASTRLDVVDPKYQVLCYG